MSKQYVKTMDSIFALSDVRRIKIGHSGAWVWLGKSKDPICLTKQEVDNLLSLLDIKDIRDSQT